METAMEDLTYEAALSRLEDIVRHLERGDLSLEDSMLRFEDGIALSRVCASRLSSAEARISRLVDEGGTLRLVPLQVEAVQ
jgi:exodeoxyribonuclease VII small subunit